MIPHRPVNIKLFFESRTAILETDLCLQPLSPTSGSPPIHTLQAAPLLAGHETITPFPQHGSHELLLPVPHIVLEVRTFLEVGNRLWSSQHSSGYTQLDHFHAITKVLALTDAKQ